MISLLLSLALTQSADAEARLWSSLGALPGVTEVSVFKADVPAAKCGMSASRQLVTQGRSPLWCLVPGSQEERESNCEALINGLAPKRPDEAKKRCVAQTQPKCGPIEISYSLRLSCSLRPPPPSLTKVLEIVNTLDIADDLHARSLPELRWKGGAPVAQSSKPRLSFMSSGRNIALRVGDRWFRGENPILEPVVAFSSLDVSSLLGRPAVAVFRSVDQSLGSQMGSGRVVLAIFELEDDQTLTARALIPVAGYLTQRPDLAPLAYQCGLLCHLLGPQGSQEVASECWLEPVIADGKLVIRSHGATPVPNECPVPDETEWCVMNGELARCATQ